MPLPRVAQSVEYKKFNGFKTWNSTVISQPYHNFLVICNYHIQNSACTLKNRSTPLQMGDGGGKSHGNNLNTRLTIEEMNHRDTLKSSRTHLYFGMWWLKGQQIKGIKI